MNRQTFQNIVIPQQEEPWSHVNPRYYHNTMVLEVANNFKQVRWLVHLWREGNKLRITHFEKELLDFVMMKGLNVVDDYTKDDEQKFINNNLQWEIPENNTKP